MGRLTGFILCWPAADGVIEGGFISIESPGAAACTTTVVRFFVPILLTLDDDELPFLTAPVLSVALRAEVVASSFRRRAPDVVLLKSPPLSLPPPPNISISEKSDELFGQGRRERRVQQALVSGHVMSMRKRNWVERARKLRPVRLRPWPVFLADRGICTGRNAFRFLPYAIHFSPSPGEKENRTPTRSCCVRK